MRRELSGAHWCPRYPGTRTTAGLALPWRRNVQAFIVALEAGDARVSIAATDRPRERAYLMHWAYLIWKKRVKPQEVPPMDGVSIDWTHATPDASWDAAAEMVIAYGLVHEPSLTSRHIPKEGAGALAIDMHVSWAGTIVVVDGRHQRVHLRASRGQDDNPDLWEVGRSYGVHKLESDPPHWSIDGH